VRHEEAATQSPAPENLSAMGAMKTVFRDFSILIAHSKRVDRRSAHVEIKVQVCPFYRSGEISGTVRQ
jgi:hypothetical protein